MLERLRSGKENVHLNWQNQLLSGKKTVVAAAQWGAALPHMYVFIDYCCVPQPLAGPMPEEHLPQEYLAKLPQNDGNDCSSEKKRDPDKNGGGGEDDDDEEGETKGEPVAIDTKAQLNETGPNKQAELLRQEAAKSLPSYMDRSCLLIVLAPPCIHADTAKTCDYRSWRANGTCRAEFAAAVMSRTDTRVLLVKGGLAATELILPVDMIQLSAGMGAFSCCVKGHGASEEGHGTSEEGNGVPLQSTCDKDVVAVVLSKMIDDKVADLFTQKRIFNARLYATLKHWYMRGLPPVPRGEVLTCVGLAAARRRLRWGTDDVEADETKMTGVGILFWCTMLNDVVAVRELAGGDAAVGDADSNTLKLHVPWLAISVVRGFTTLHAACAWASFEVVELLLSLGLNPNATTEKETLNVMAGAAIFNRGDIITQWVARFPDFDLEHRDTLVGTTVLGNAVFSGSNKRYAIEALINAGASTECRADNGECFWTQN